MTEAVHPTKRQYSFINIEGNRHAGYYARIKNGWDGAIVSSDPNPIREMALNGLYLKMLQNAEQVKAKLKIRPIMGITTIDRITTCPLTPNAMLTIKAIMNFGGEVEDDKIPLI